ncbi:MAG: TPM domain-containing protein [Erysipelotrichaceae bacterium]|nr:TPM domain-containing protein [Erysipelotrichaceae bacterium]
MKRLISLLFISFMVFTCFMPPVFAEGKTYIVDENGWLTDSDIEQINEKAAELETDTGVECLFGYVTGDPQEELDTIVNELGTADKSIVFTLNDEFYYAIGSYGFTLSDDQLNSLVKAFDSAPDLTNGPIAMMDEVYNLASEPMLIDNLEDVPSVDTTPSTSTNSKDLLVDDAGLLRFDEAENIRQALEDLSLAHGMDFVLVTVNSLNGYDIEDFADYYYYEHGYGQGVNRDGVMFLISMGEREYHFTTTGEGYNIFDDYSLKKVDNAMYPYLRNGDYYSAFATYVNQCDSIVKAYQLGETETSGSSSGTTTESGRSPLWIPGSLGLGALVAGAVTGAQRSELKSVFKKDSASSYTTKGGLQLFDTREYFLYRNVMRTRRPQQSSQSRSSTTHVGRSGMRHGGRSGKF